MFKKMISCIVVFTILITSFPFSGLQNSAYAQADNIHVFTNERGTWKITLPAGYTKSTSVTVSGKQYRINLRLLEDEGIIVFGEDKESFYKSINPSAKDQKNGQYRYLGYDISGNKYTNVHFPNDADSFRKPYEKNIRPLREMGDWENDLKDHPAAEDTIYDILVEYGFDTHGKSKRELFDEYSTKFYIQSLKAEGVQSSIRFYHRVSGGAIWYQTLVKNYSLEKEPVKMDVHAAFDLNREVFEYQPTGFKDRAYGEGTAIETWRLTVKNRSTGRTVKSFDYPEEAERELANGLKEGAYSFELYVDNGEAGEKFRSDRASKSLDVVTQDPGKAIAIVSGDPAAAIGKPFTITAELSMPSEGAKIIEHWFQEAKGSPIGFQDILAEQWGDQESFELTKDKKGDYYYRVKVRDTNGVESAWSEPFLVMVTDDRVASAKPFVRLPKVLYEGVYDYVRTGGKVSVREDGENKSYSASKAYDEGYTGFEHVPGREDNEIVEEPGTRWKASGASFYVRSVGDGRFSWKYWLYPINGADAYAIDYTTVRPTPVANLDVYGQFKENRKVTIDANESLYHVEHSRAWEKTYLEITRLATGQRYKIDEGDSLNNGDIKTKDFDNLTMDLHFVHAGEYKIRFYTEDDRGSYDETTKTITIREDKAPVADMSISDKHYRHPVTRKTCTEITLKSRSVDGDILGYQRIRYQYDRDNDNDFNDEPWKDLKAGYELDKVILETPDVGKYRIELLAKEEPVGAYIPAFFGDREKKGAAVTKIIEVDNIAPVTSVMPIKAKDVDILLLSDEKKTADNQVAALKDEITKDEAYLIKPNVEVGAFTTDESPAIVINDQPNMGNYWLANRPIAPVDVINSNIKKYGGYEYDDYHDLTFPDQQIELKDYFIYRAQNSTATYINVVDKKTLSLQMSLADWMVIPLKDTNSFVCAGKFYDMDTRTSYDLGSISEESRYAADNWRNCQFIRDDRYVYYCFRGGVNIYRLDLTDGKIDSVSVPPLYEPDFRGVEREARINNNYKLLHAENGELFFSSFSAHHWFGSCYESNRFYKSYNIYRVNEALQVTRTASVKDHNQYYLNWSGRNRYLPMHSWATHKHAKAYCIVDDTINVLIQDVRRVAFVVIENEGEDDEYDWVSNRYYPLYTLLKLNKQGELIEKTEKLMCPESGWYSGYDDEHKNLWWTGRFEKVEGQLAFETLVIGNGIHGSGDIGRFVFDDKGEVSLCEATSGNFRRKRDGRYYYYRTKVYRSQNSKYYYVYCQPTWGLGTHWDWREYTNAQNKPVIKEIINQETGELLYGFEQGSWTYREKFKGIYAAAIEGTQYEVTYRRDKQYIFNVDTKEEIELDISVPIKRAFKYRDQYVFLPLYGDAFYVYSTDKGLQTVHTGIDCDIEVTGFTHEYYICKETGQILILFQENKNGVKSYGYKGYTLSEGFFEVEDLIAGHGFEAGKPYIGFYTQNPITYTTDKLNSLADTIKAKGAKVFFVGKTHNKPFADSLTGKTGGQYEYFNSWDADITSFAEYIKDQEGDKTNNDKTLFVKKGEAIDYETFYADFESDPKYALAGDRWLYEHNPHYYSQNDGYAGFHNVERSTPVMLFDKVGEYRVYFRNKDNPKNDNRFDGYRKWSNTAALRIIVYEEEVTPEPPPVVNVVPLQLNVDISGDLRAHHRVDFKVSATQGTHAIDWSSLNIAFDRAGYLPYTKPNTQQFSRVFSHTGNHTITVNLKDTSGKEVTAVKTFHIAQNLAPIARMSISGDGKRDEAGNALFVLQNNSDNTDDAIGSAAYYIERTTYKEAGDGTLVPDGTSYVPLVPNKYGEVALNQVGSNRIKLEVEEFYTNGIGLNGEDLDQYRNFKSAADIKTVNVINEAPTLDYSVVPEVILKGESVTHRTSVADDTTIGDYIRYRFTHNPYGFQNHTGKNPQADHITEDAILALDHKGLYNFYAQVYDEDGAASGWVYGGEVKVVSKPAADFELISDPALNGGENTEFDDDFFKTDSVITIENHAFNEDYGNTTPHRGIKYVKVEYREITESSYTTLYEQDNLTVCPTSFQLPAIRDRGVYEVKMTIRSVDGYEDTTTKQFTMLALQLDAELQPNAIHASQSYTIKATVSKDCTGVVAKDHMGRWVKLDQSKEDAQHQYFEKTISTLDTRVDGNYPVEVYGLYPFGNEIRKDLTLNVHTSLVLNVNLDPSYPDSIPASEQLQVTATTESPIEVTSVSAWLEGLGTILLNKINQVGDIGTWTGSYTVPAATRDKDYYDFHVKAVLPTGKEASATEKVNVQTPIDLSAAINDMDADAEIYADDTNRFKLYTSLYVDKAEIAFLGHTYTSSAGEIVLLGDNGTTKIWEMELVVPPETVTEGETGYAAFTALLPSGLSESVHVNYKVIAVKLENLRIVNIGDYNWERTFVYVNGKPTALQQKGIPVKDMPADVNKQGQGIKLGYAAAFKIDSAGLNKADSTVAITAHYFALDRKNRLHRADIYVEDRDGNYVKLEDSEYDAMSKSILLDASDRHVYESEPGKTNYNTWGFELFLPYSSKVVKQGEALDLYRDNTFDYRLIVALDILGQQYPGSGVYDYTARETEWGTGDGSVYGGNLPTASDLLGKGMNHGEVFWYNLYETLMDDIHLDRRW